MGTLKIEVTQDHINKGKPGNCRECAIAQSLLGDGVNVTVGMGGVNLNGKIYRFTKEFQQFVSRFDTYGAEGVQPATFTLEEMTQSV